MSPSESLIKPIRSLLAVSLTIVMATPLHAGWVGGFGLLSLGFVSQERPASSYRTDLWNMEFQKQQDRDEDNGRPSDRSGDSDTGESESPEEDWGLVPGHRHLAEVNSETPFAEWQIEKTVASSLAGYSGTPSAWLMSRIRVGGAGVEELPMADGPSMLTLLVAVIACMVMIGALFADR